MADFLNNVDIFAVIIIRMVGFFSIAPVVGGRNIPAMIRIAMALTVSVIVFNTGIVKEIEYFDSVLGYGILLLKEFFVGFTIGFVALFFFNTAYLAGLLNDQQIGLSMAAVFDPVNQMQVPITGNIYFYMFTAIMIVTGGHRMLISSIYYSYSAIPVGGALLVGNESLYNLMMRFFNSFFMIGASMALPIIGVLLVIDVALGIMVKTAPRLNVFVVGMPVKVMVGLISIWIIIPIFDKVYNILYTTVSENLLTVIKVMMP
ncbi:MAG: flagellar biosynthetic protein FliR [Firmicutes bacterium]|nr:flagellar biosynthetic protein FliR [Bacillota bacterium]